VTTPVEELEHRFLPLLQAARDAAAARFPDYLFEVYSGPVGGLTSWQGHDVGLDASFPDASAREANGVAISIGLCHLTTEPTIWDAGLSWNQGQAPDACAELDLVGEPVVFSSEALAAIEREFPALLDALLQALNAWQSRTPA
jgi:hypothetical protein